MKIIPLAALILFMVSCASSRFSGKGVPNRGGIVATAEKYIGVRYKRGGSDPKGFDCSGLVMFVYDRHGISLPRTADAQYREGRRVPIRRASPGDLVFFRTSGRAISHVGIYAGNGRFIHAPSSGKRVSYADIRNPYWKKRFIVAVSILGRG